ncbi:hypothetical protein MC885_001112, partial [Smutsia gigantea]
MAVTTRLTWDEEKSLQKLLGNVTLGLIYKSSVHGCNMLNMLAKCDLQGSTITVIYLPNSIVGVFILGHYPQIDTDSNKPKSSFYFSLQNNETTEMEAAFLNTVLKITCEKMTFYFSDCKIFSLFPSQMTLYTHHMFRDILGVNISSVSEYLECEVFRVEGIKDDARYIHRITRSTQHRDRLLEDLRAYKPYADLVSKVRILLLGPVGSGKSSFFNSVKSVFHGHVTHQATVGSDITSITEQYRIYSVKDGKDGKSLAFMLCDSMGLDEKQGVGLCMDDIPYILKGCVPDRYQFSPHKPIMPKHSTFILSPSLKDKIHCVAYVLDINSINNLSSKMVALLTKVNNYNEVLQEDFLNMDKSMTSQSQVLNINKMLNIPICNILMVENYAAQWEQDPLKDILILSALRQMLRAADDFLEDLPHVG